MVQLLKMWHWCLQSGLPPAIVGIKRLDPDTGQGEREDKEASGQSFSSANLECLTQGEKQLHSIVAPQILHRQSYCQHLTLKECLFKYATFRQQAIFLFIQFPCSSLLCCLHEKNGSSSGFFYGRQ